ncbi:MAG: Gfo/Idh/MocA family oxidoreductase [Planctomycetaceae bacterium]
MVRIGIIGIGFMGYTHFEAATKLRGGKVTAIATRNLKKLKGDWRGIQGNFGPPAGKVDLKGKKTYANYQELLDDPDIDLVDICLPTEMHEQVTIEALNAGKHVLVEKPIALDLKTANRMVRVAQKNDRLLMVGHVLPYFPEFNYLKNCVDKQTHGRLLAAHFRRVIAPPNWSDDISDYRKLGGWGIDLHIHDNHLIALLCGVPQAVFARGILQDGLVNHVHSQYIFEDSKPAVSCVSGGIASKELQFGHGFEIYFEKATLLYSAGTINGEWRVDRPLTLVPKTGKPRTPTLKGGSEWYAAFSAELKEAVNGVNSGTEPLGISGALARDALKICHAEAKSIETGKIVRVK